MEESTSKIEKEVKVEYQDFEPYCAWLRHQESDTLAVHLPGFTKEQIRVQANSERLLVIHGQRPITDEADTWARFSKHVKLPEGCDENKITAKFVSGILTIVMRKKDSLIVKTAGVINGDRETRSSESTVHNNSGQKIGNCAIKRATEDHGHDSMRGLLSLAGKVVAVAIVVAVSGVYVHACITKKRPCNVVN